MLYLAKPGKVFFNGKPVNFRKQTAGLAAIVDSKLPGQLSLLHFFLRQQTRERQKFSTGVGTGQLYGSSNLSEKPANYGTLGKLSLGC